MQTLFFTDIMQFSLGYRLKKTTYMDFYFCSIYKRFSVSLDVTVFTCILFTLCSIIISRTASHLIIDFGLKHSGDGHTPPHHTALKTDWFVNYPCWFSTEQFTFHTFKLILNSAFHFCISFTGCINYRLHTLHHCFSSGSPCAPLVFVSLPSCPISVWPLRSVWLHAGGSCSTDFSSPVHILPTTALAPLKSRFFVFSVRKWDRGHLRVKSVIQLNPRS